MDQISNNQSLTKQIEQRLTKKNIAFIKYISQGLKVKEAYKLAGYKGSNDQQPYQLMSQLKHKIQEYLENNGFNKARVAIELEKLLDLPLRDDQKSVTIEQRLKMIGLLNKALPEEKKQAHEFTRFQIVNNTLTLDSKHLDHDQKDLDVIDVNPSEPS